MDTDKPILSYVSREKPRSLSTPLTILGVVALLIVVSLYLRSMVHSVPQYNDMKNTGRPFLVPQ